jgi:hypothetical protein
LEVNVKPTYYEAEIGENITIFFHVNNYTDSYAFANNNLTIYFPNMTVWVNSLMDNYTNGTYGYSFIAPQTLGVYVAYDNISTSDNYTIGIANIHVTPWTETSKLISNASLSLSQSATNIESKTMHIPILDDLSNAINSLKTFLSTYMIGVVVVLILLFGGITVMVAIMSRRKEGEREGWF